MSKPRGFFSKQMCCYYCRALAWVYTSSNPQDVELLYTNFGEHAAHRNTLLGMLCLWKKSGMDFQYFLINRETWGKHLRIYWKYDMRISIYIYIYVYVRVFVWQYVIGLDKFSFGKFPLEKVFILLTSFPKPGYSPPMRLVSLEEWLDISTVSPICSIPGWSPWRHLSKQLQTVLVPTP